MKNIIKKRILVFLLCFCLILPISAYTQKRDIVLGAELVSALSFLNLGLYAYGINYFGNGSNKALQDTVVDYCNSIGSNITSWLTPLQNVIVDVGKKAIKFSAAQIFIVKDFINYLIGKNKITDNINVINYSGNYIYDSDHNMISYYSPTGTFIVKVTEYDSTSDIIEYKLNRPCFVSGCNDGYFVICSFYSDLSGTYTKTMNDDNPMNGNIYNVKGTRLNNTNLYYYANRNGYVPSFGYGCFINGFPLFQNFSSYITYLNLINKKYSNDIILEISNFSYSNIAGLKDIDTSKDLVVSSPSLIDKAKENAISNGNTNITATDLSNAIDKTIIGSAEIGKETNEETGEEEDKVVGVITPDLIIEDTQADDVVDEIVEDTVIEDVKPDEPTDPDDDNDNNSLIALSNILKTKFPFSMPYNFLFLLGLFDAPSDAPKFNLGFNVLNSDYEFVIDLSPFDNVASILRLMEIIAFISGLAFLSFKFLRD